MKADAQTEAEIKALMDDLWKGYGQKNLEACMALFTGDADFIAIGTGIDEQRCGPEGLRSGIQRDFEQAESMKVKTEWLRVSAAGTVAWSAANITMTVTVNGNEVPLPVRMTTVYEKRDGTWRIMQFHLCLPATGQDEGESFPTQ